MGRLWGVVWFLSVSRGVVAGPAWAEAHPTCLARGTFAFFGSSGFRVLGAGTRLCLGDAGPGPLACGALRQWQGRGGSDRRPRAAGRPLWSLSAQRQNGPVGQVPPGPVPLLL